MQPPLLPLFPLQAVLFPRTPMPLHIFEERYREMFGEILAEKGSEFGIVLASPKGIASLGCTAVVDRVLERHEDGRLDIVTSGRRRFEIQSVNEERSFLRGRVEFFDDETDEEVAVEPEDRERVTEAWKELSQFAGVEHEPRWTDPQVSFQIASAIPDLEFRQSLLGIRSETRRLKEIAEYLPGYLRKQKYTQHIQQVAPRNGHGKRRVEEQGE